MPRSYDVAIVGAGPAGTICALALLRAGLRPLLIEKTQFPRYHIGESLSGRAAVELRRLGLGPQIEAQKFPIKYGVKVYGTNGAHSFWVPVQQPDDKGNWLPGTTWQVQRATFDQLLLEAAQERGADLLAGEALYPTVQADAVTGLQVRAETEKLISVQAPITVDASGQATFLASKSQVTSGKQYGKYAKQIAVFAQVANLDREPADRADTLIFYRERHHWAWFIPVDERVVSIGIVTPSSYYKSQNCTPEAFLRQELKTLNPELARRVSVNYVFTTPVHTASNYSYEVKEFTGKGFLCVGDAHRFIDPIFSFGVNFAILEGLFAAQAICRELDVPTAAQEAPLAAYQTLVKRGQDIAQDLIDCFWEHPLPFLIISQYQYQADVTKLFGGNLYGDDVAQWGGVRAMRALLYGAAELSSDERKSALGNFGL